MRIFNSTYRERMLAGAYAYAQFDRSDPFAYSRAVTHTNNGVASIDGPDEKFYNAHRKTELRKVTGLDGRTLEFQAEVYTGAQRP